MIFLVQKLAVYAMELLQVQRCHKFKMLSDRCEIGNLNMLIKQELIES